VTVGSPRAALPRKTDTILAPNARGLAMALGIASSTPWLPGGSTPTRSGVWVNPPL
jgi:hypothetical protein